MAASKRVWLPALLLLLGLLAPPACLALQVEFPFSNEHRAGSVVQSFQLSMTMDEGESFTSTITDDPPARVEIIFPTGKGFMMDKTQFNPFLDPDTMTGYDEAPSLDLDTPNEIRFIGGQTKGTVDYLLLECLRCFQLPEMPLSTDPMVIHGVQVIMRLSNGQISASNLNVSIPVYTTQSIQAPVPSDLISGSTEPFQLQFTPTFIKYAPYARPYDFFIYLNELQPAANATPALTIEPNDFGVATYDPGLHALVIANVTSPLDMTSYLATFSGLQLTLSFNLTLLCTTTGLYGIFGTYFIPVEPPPATSGSITLDPPFTTTYTRMTVNFQPSVALVPGSTVKIVFPSHYLNDFESRQLTIIAPSHPDIASVEKIGDEHYPLLTHVLIHIGKDIAVNESVSVTFEGVATGDFAFTPHQGDIQVMVFGPASNVAINGFYSTPSTSEPPHPNHALGLQVTAFSASYSNNKTSNFVSQRNAATLQFTISYGLTRDTSIRLRFPKTSGITIAADASVSLGSVDRCQFKCNYAPVIGAMLTEHLPRGTYTLVLDGIINPAQVKDLSNMYLEFVDRADRVLVTLDTFYTLEQDTTPPTAPPSTMPPPTDSSGSNGDSSGSSSGSGSSGSDGDGGSQSGSEDGAGNGNAAIMTRVSTFALVLSILCALYYTY